VWRYRSFVFPDFLAAGEIEPVDAAVVGADESAAAGESPSGTGDDLISPSVLCVHAAAPSATFTYKETPSGSRVEHTLEWMRFDLRGLATNIICSFGDRLRE
jgi:hypothetical protein